MIRESEHNPVKLPAHRGAAAPRCALISMPWATPLEPPLGLGILTAQLRLLGIEARAFHLHVKLLRYLTPSAYADIAESYTLNEFAFTGVLDDETDSAQIDWLLRNSFYRTHRDVRLTARSVASFGQMLIKVRHQAVPKYLAECAEEIVDFAPTLIGFSCLFDQTMASLALAALLRPALPDALIIFGGAAIKEPAASELLRVFPQMDAMAIGDGEPVIGLLAQASVGEVNLKSIPGVLARDGLSSLPPVSCDTETSPVPDYSDWFADLDTLRTEDKVTIKTYVLPAESSRGCWWGQKHHCKFCGIDEPSLHYRQKRPETVLAMLRELRNRHGEQMCFRLHDYILPHSYWKDLLPSLTQVEPRFLISCEIKANQTSESIRQLVEAGFRGVQPGIESFDSNLLRLMGKGVTGIQNVELLKLASVHRLVMNYNLLFGIAGEKEEWYARLVAMLPRLHHLIPPARYCETLVTRFSPISEQPLPNGVKPVLEHNEIYSGWFSRSFIESTGLRLDNLAYYLGRRPDYPVEMAPWHEKLSRAVHHWKRLHHLRDVILSYRIDEDGIITIEDSRFDVARELRLNQVQSQVYLACDKTRRSIRSIAEQLRASGLTAVQVQETVEFLDAESLVWREDEQVLGLAILQETSRVLQADKWKRCWPALFL